MHNNINRHGWYTQANIKSATHKTSRAISLAPLLAVPLAVGTYLSTPTPENKQQPTPSTQSAPSTQPTTRPIDQPITQKSTKPSAQTSSKNESKVVEKTDARFEAVMHAIHMKESSGGVNNKPRYEPGFHKRYIKKCTVGSFKNDPLYKFARDLVAQHGEKAAATSYGPYQIMLFKAWEKGFRVSPEELSDPATSRKIAEAIVRPLYNKNKENVWNIFKAYNGADEYADDAMEIYQKKLENSK